MLIPHYLEEVSTKLVQILVSVYSFRMPLKEVSIKTVY